MFEESTPPRKQYHRPGIASRYSPGSPDSPPEGASTTSASVSSSTSEIMNTPDDERLARPYLRTNFARGYVPPRSNDGTLSGPPKIDRTKDAWEDDASVPFDQRRDVMPAARNDAPDDIPDDETSGFGGTGRVGASPRVTTPPAYEYHTPDQAIKTSGSPILTHPATESPPSQDDSSVSDTEAMRNNNNNIRAEELNYHSDDGDDDYPLPNPEDDDSLFDFEEQQNATTRLTSRFRTSPRARVIREEFSEDDTSFEDYGPARNGPSGLQERSQQAWASRSKAQKSQANPSGTPADPSVSFGEHHTVHEFETVPAYDEETLDTLGTNQSNVSTYSKSMESEVEDIVKDLFFIGSGKKTKPGRRKVRDQPGRKRLARSLGDDTTQNTQDDSLTLNTLDDIVEGVTAFTGAATAQSGHTKDTYSTLAGEEVALESTPDTDHDLLVIGSGKKTKTDRRKVQEQPSKKLEARSLGDDTTQNTQDDSLALNTLDDILEGVTALTGAALTQSGQKKDSYSALTREEVVLESTPEVDQAKNVTGKTSEPKRKEKKEEENVPSAADTNEDPLGAVWNYVEGGISAMGLAFGISDDADVDRMAVGENESKPKTLEQTNVAATSLQKPDESISDPPTSVKPVHAPTNENSTKGPDVEVEYEPKITTISSPRKGVSKKREPNADEELGPFDEVMNMFFGGEGGSMLEASSSGVSTSQIDDDFVARPRSDAQTNESTDGITPLEEDSRLEGLAVHAARSKHRLVGKVFNEKEGLNVVKDIKIFVVKLALPLGLLFQENGGGCWVTKVFDDGNAAKNGSVDVGDQLAAINGESAIDLKVDEICVMITESPDPDDVALTFLRYTGPIRSTLPKKKKKTHRGTAVDRKEKKAKNPQRATSSGVSSESRQIHLSTKTKEQKSQDKMTAKTTQDEKKTKRFGKLFGRRKKS